MTSVSANNLETVSVQLKNGKEIKCGVVCIFPVPQMSNQFIALNPLSDSEFGREDEIQLFSLIPVDNDNHFEVAEIDESIFDIVSTAFFKIIED